MNLNKRMHLCAKGEGTDSCLADSGGPLVCFPKEEENHCPRSWLTGVISWGVKCNHQELAGIFNFNK